jgi:hypothetical protein
VIVASDRLACDHHHHHLRVLRSLGLSLSLLLSFTPAPLLFSSLSLSSPCDELSNEVLQWPRESASAKIWRPLRQLATLRGVDLPPPCQQRNLFMRQGALER